MPAALAESTRTQTPDVRPRPRTSSHEVAPRVAAQQRKDVGESSLTQPAPGAARAPSRGPDGRGVRRATRGCSAELKQGFGPWACPPRVGTSSWASRISWRTRALDVRTPCQRNRAHTLRWPAPSAAEYPSNTDRILCSPSPSWQRPRACPSSPRFSPHGARQPLRRGADATLLHIAERCPVHQTLTESVQITHARARRPCRPPAG